MTSPRRRKVLKAGLWISGILVAGVVAAWGVAYAVGRATLAAALEELRAGGFASSLADLAPPPLPTERNAAEVYRSAFTLAPDTDDADEAFSRAFDEGFAALDAEAKEAIRRALDGAAEYFAQLRLGRERGACLFAHDYAKGVFMDVAREAGDLLRSVRLLSLQAQIDADAGRGGEAREAVRDLLALADAYRAEPTLLFQIVRMAALAAGIDAVHRCVGPDATAADLRAWADLAPSLDGLEAEFDRALQGELAGAAQVAARPLGDVLAEARRSGQGGQVSGLSGLMAPWWKLSGARYLRALRGMIESSRKPYPTAIAEIEAAEIRQREEAGVLDIFSRLLLPALRRTVDQRQALRAAAAVLRAGLAAEIARAATGRYPETLDIPDPLGTARLGYAPAEGRIQSAGVSGWTAEEHRRRRLVWTLRRGPVK